MVNAGSDEGQTNRDIDPLIDTQVLHRYQPLIVVLGHNDIKFACPGSCKHGVTRAKALDTFDPFSLARKMAGSITVDSS